MREPFLLYFKRRLGKILAVMGLLGGLAGIIAIVLGVIPIFQTERDARGGDIVNATMIAIQEQQLEVLKEIGTLQAMDVLSGPAATVRARQIEELEITAAALEGTRIAVGISSTSAALEGARDVVEVSSTDDFSLTAQAISERLKEIIAPLPSGQVVIIDGFVDYDRSGFQFSSGSLVSWSSKQADILVAKSEARSSVMLFLPYYAPPYDNSDTGQDAVAEIVKMYQVELGHVTECPISGYQHHWVDADQGSLYCVRTRDGQYYAKFQITEVTDTSITLSWVYQPDGRRCFCPILKLNVDP